MTHKQIMVWGKQWHYLYLQIGQEDTPPTQEVLRHGKEHYEALRNAPKRRKLTSLRIERFPARLTRVQVSQAIERVEALKSTKCTAPSKTEEERIQV
jgi:hypothetical protein